MHAVTDPQPRRVASLSTLPPECLQLVLEFLQTPTMFDRGASLARLMQVNSYFCSVALPYLYGSLFSGMGLFTQTRTLVDPRLFAAIQTVLRHRPAAEISDLLSAAFGNDSPLAADEQSQGLELVRDIDYLSAIRSFKPFGMDFKPQFCAADAEHPYAIVHDWRHYPSHLAEMVFKSKETNHEDLSPSALPQSTSSAPSPFVAATRLGDGVFDENLSLPLRATVGYSGDVPTRYTAVTTAIRRDLTWTICSPIFEQIEEIIIPLSEVSRYLDVVHRFRSLKAVQFTMDELLQPPSTYERLHMSLTQQDEDNLETCQQKQDRQFRVMVEFTRRHCDLFPSLLKVAGCPDDYLWSRKMICPSNILDELKICLPPLRAPRMIDFRNWRQVALKLKQTDLRRVDVLHLLNSETMYVSAIFWKSDPTFMARCRTLRTLNLVTPGAGSFQWAMKERKAWNQHLAASASRASLDNLNSELPKEPASLKNIFLMTPEYFNDELDDIMYAFGDSLESAEFGSDLQDLFVDEHAPFTIGRGWRLPKIIKLMVEMPRLRLLVDSDLYLHLGNTLQRLDLSDKATLPYHPQEIYTCHPFLDTMSELTDIVLQGWPALTFHPDNLHRVPNLKTLELKMYRTYEMPQFYPTMEDLHTTVFFIQHPQTSLSSPSLYTTVPTTGMTYSAHSPQDPSPLDQPRPLWTWDWHLPHLESLQLDNVFSLLFKFQLLASCPSLQRLILNLQFQGTTMGCQRVLSLRDFTLSGTPLSVPSASSSTSDEDSSILVVPSLKELHFHGGWIMDDELRGKVFKTTFPGLVTLDEYFTGGCTSWGWVKALHFGVPSLRTASRYISLAAFTGSEQILEDHGLVRKTVSAPTFGVGFGFGAHPSTEENTSYKTTYTMNGVAWQFPEEVKSETEE